jgi:hypothetical protein
MPILGHRDGMAILLLLYVWRTQTRYRSRANLEEHLTAWDGMGKEYISRRHSCELISTVLVEAVTRSVARGRPRIRQKQMLRGLGGRVDARGRRGERDDGSKDLLAI